MGVSYMLGDRIYSLGEARAVREVFKMRDAAEGKAGMYTYKIRARGRRATQAAADWLNKKYPNAYGGRGYNAKQAGRAFQSHLPLELGEWFAIYKYENTGKVWKRVGKVEKAYKEATGENMPWDIRKVLVNKVRENLGFEPYKYFS